MRWNPESGGRMFPQPSWCPHGAGGEARCDSVRVRRRQCIWARQARQGAGRPVFAAATKKAAGRAPEEGMGTLGQEGQRPSTGKELHEAIVHELDGQRRQDQAHDSGHDV